MHHRVFAKEIPDRIAFLRELTSGRRVLHVGCCDVPIFDPDNNLHLTLATVTRYLDGLDVSQEGLAVLARHVRGDFYTSAREIRKQYEVVLVPEVLEHTHNPGSFLEEIFSVQAQAYFVSAPSFEWYRETRVDGDYVFETVHADHKAFYSPYTLVAALRPFIDENADDIELFRIAKTGSVAALVRKQRPVGLWDAPASPRLTFEEASALGESESALALSAFARLYDEEGAVRALYAELALSLSLKKHLSTLRRAVAAMKSRPHDAQLLLFAADATEALGDASRAAELRELGRLRAEASR